MRRPTVHAWGVPQSDAVASIAQKNLERLDALFENSPSKLDDSEKATSQKVQTLPKNTVGSRDQRAAFRNLTKQFEAQTYIMSILGKAAQKRRSGLLGMVPALEWVADNKDDDYANAVGIQSTTLPVVLRSRPLGPGELMVMYVVEPRWVTLFAKLTADEESSQIMRSASGYRDVKLNTDPVLSNAIKLYEMNSSKTEQLEREQLQSALSQYPMYSNLVSGYGRLDEAPFIGTKRFAACLKTSAWGKEKPSTVGTIAEILGTDVKTAEDGTPMLVVVARGLERIRITNVQQEEPYFVADTVPFVDVPEAGQLITEHATRKLIQRELAKGLPVMPKVANNISAAAKNELEVFRKLHDNMVNGITAQSKKLSAVALGSMIMNGKPTAAQSLLASTSAQQRQALVEKWLSDE